MNLVAGLKVQQITLMGERENKNVFGKVGDEVDVSTFLVFGNQKSVLTMP